LLHDFPHVLAQVDGYDVLLVLNGNLGAALSRACSDSVDQDALHFAKAAETVGEMCSMEYGILMDVLQFNSGSRETSMPLVLLAVVSMILEGPGIDLQSAPQNVPDAVTVAQFTVFNSMRQKCNIVCLVHILVI
jgi:hypothetical protein